MTSQQAPAATASPAETASWKDDRPTAGRNAPGAGELSEALTGAKKHDGLAARLRNIIKAVIRFFIGAKAPANEPLERVASAAAKGNDLQTLTNTELLRQLDTANRNVSGSIKMLDQPISAQKMAERVAGDPNILRLITAPAASLSSLTQPGAAEKIIAAHGLQPADQTRRTDDFRQAADLLAQIYSTKFRPEDSNTAFARFGAADNNPYQQLARDHGLSMEADADLRDWLQMAVTYADRAAVAMLESAEGSETQVDLEQLEREVQSFTSRPAEDRTPADDAGND